MDFDKRRRWISEEGPGGVDAHLNEPGLTCAINLKSSQVLLNFKCQRVIKNRFRRPAAYVIRKHTKDCASI